MGPCSAVFHLCKLGPSLHTCEQGARMMPTSVVVVGNLTPMGRGRQGCRAPEGREGGSPVGVTRGDGQGVGERGLSREDRAGFPNDALVANSAPQSGCPSEWTTPCPSLRRPLSGLLSSAAGGGGGGLDCVTEGRATSDGENLGENVRSAGRARPVHGDGRLSMCLWSLDQRVFPSSL